MLVIKKELDYSDFSDEFKDELKDLNTDAQIIIYDFLDEVFYDGIDNMTIKDYLRFQMKVETLSEVLENYNVVDDVDIEELSEEEKTQKVTDYLDYYTTLLGTFEENGETYFIFDEF